MRKVPVPIYTDNPSAPPIVDVTDRPVDPAQACRTCTNRTNRLHHLDFMDVVRAQQQGTEREELFCQPDEPVAFRKVLNNRQVVDIDAPAPTITKTVPCSTCGENHTREEIPFTSRTAAFVHSCGQNVRRDCQNCARFRPTIVTTHYESFPGGPIRNRQLVVGGHCSIPAQGVEIDGEIITCNFVPKPKYRTVEPSCMNCEFRESFGTDWIIDDLSMTVGKVDLTRYEKQRLRRGVGYASDQIPLAIGAARRSLENAGAGIWHYYEATVLDIKTTTERRITHVFDDRGRDICPKVEVTTEDVEVIPGRFTNNGFELRSRWNQADHLRWERSYDEWLAEHYREWIAADTTRVMVKTTERCEPPVVETSRPTELVVAFDGNAINHVLDLDVDPSIIAVEPLDGYIVPRRISVRILQPYHRQFMLADSTRRADPSFADVVLPPSEPLEATLTPANPSRLHANLLEGGDGRCPRCDHERDIACYWHARLPRWSRYTDPVTGEGHAVFVYDKPAGNDVRFQENAAARNLHIEVRRGTFMVLDGNNNTPNLWVFRLRRRELLAQARRRYGPEAVVDIERQYLAAISQLGRGRARMVHNTHGLPWHGIEPFKPYCTAWLATNGAEGLDLREALGDAFGRERTAITTNHVQAAALGVPARRDRHFASALALDSEEWSRTTNPAERITEEEHITARTFEDSDIERQKVDWQAVHFTTKRIATGHVAMVSEDTSAETKEFLRMKDTPVTLNLEAPTPKVITGDVERTWALYGYRTVKARAKDKRESPDLGIEFNYAERDVNDVGAHYRCEQCGAVRSPETVDAFSLVCNAPTAGGEDCDGILIWCEPRIGEHNLIRHRLKRGIGDTVVHRMSPGFRTQTVLMNTVCPNWQMRGTHTRPVTLDTIYPDHTKSE